MNDQFEVVVRKREFGSGVIGRLIQNFGFDIAKVSILSVDRVYAQHGIQLVTLHSPPIGAEIESVRALLII